MTMSGSVGEFLIDTLGEVAPGAQPLVDQAVLVFQTRGPQIEYRLRETYNAALYVYIEAKIGKAFTIYLDFVRFAQQKRKRRGIMTVVNFGALDERILDVIHRLYEATFLPPMMCYCCGGTVHEYI